MHEELMEDAIVNKVGGRFKLSTLIQKRLVALNSGARPLVDSDNKEVVTALREVAAGKVELQYPEE